MQESRSHRRPSTAIPRAARALLRDGWAFFVPYTLVYLGGMAVDATCDTLRIAFAVLHAVFLLLSFVLLRTWVRSGRRGARRAICFWLALGLVFLLPGAYLEFPGDGWVHLHRLNMYDGHEHLRAATWSHRFAYFWGWSILGGIAPVHQRAAHAGYSALWQMLLAYQFYRFARRLGFSQTWSGIQVFGVIALFGNNVFGFFRYYALGSTPLAYIAYLRGTIAFLDLVERRGSRLRSTAVLVLALLLMATNHMQEVLLAIVSSATVAVTAWLVKRPRRRLALLSGVLLTYAVCFLLANQLLGRPDILGGARAHFALPYVSSELGCFRMWDPNLSYFHTIGAPGLLAWVLAVVACRRTPLLSALTLAAPALLLFPPFCLALAAFAPGDVTYRLLFLIPSSFMIVGAILALGTERPSAGPPERVRQVLAVAALIALGALHFSPFFGKLRFQLFRPGPYLSASYVDPAAQWFSEERRLPKECVVTSDAVTETVLASLTGMKTNVEKASGLRWTYAGYRTIPAGPYAFLDYARWQLPYSSPDARSCGLLLIDPELYRDRIVPETSWVGMNSRHWTVDSADPLGRTDPGLVDAAAVLPRLRWRRTFVPPFYWYYEPPRS